MDYQVKTLSERPDLAPSANVLDVESWPTFIGHDAVSMAYWPRLTDEFGEFQAVLLNEENAVVAVAHTIPIYWDGTTDGLPSGWDSALEQGFAPTYEGREPNALCALSAVVSRSKRGQALSYKILDTMKSIARTHNLGVLIAPVRPSLKAQYPITPIERYLRWQRADGLPFDPWVRAHTRLGAHLLKIAPASMLITGTVAEWETWTNMALPETGRYIVPGALEPIDIDTKQDLGKYVEPNVWMLHDAGGSD